MNRCSARIAAMLLMVIVAPLLTPLPARADVILEVPRGIRRYIDETYGTRLFLNVLPAHMPVDFLELGAAENKDERLFEQFLLFPSDIGKTFTVTAETDPGFAAAVARLTDGLNNAVFVGDMGIRLIDGQEVPREGRGGLSEHELLFLNQGDRVDLAGYEITAIHMRLEAQGETTLIFEGTVIPEPAAGLGLLIAGTCALRRPRRPHQTHADTHWA